MPDLSACYFCGTALDEPLSEYPVVPRTLQPTPDQQRTVVLCSTCRRKLGQVVDTVVDAVADQPIDETVQQGLTTTDADAMAGEASATVEGDENADESTDARTDEDTDDGADESRENGWTTPPSGEDESATADGIDADAADATEDPATVEVDVTPPPGTEPNRDETTTGEGSTANANEPDSPPSEAGDAEDGDDEDDGSSLTALEYTKVMRLLENRELPVDREEIRVVATNAYEIRPREFDAVVDAAIERGLIVEEDGQFVAVE